MLWNIDQDSAKSNRISIQREKPTGSGPLKGHALTVKEEYIESSDGHMPLLTLCAQVRKRAAKEAINLKAFRKNKLIMDADTFLESHPSQVTNTMSADVDLGKVEVQIYPIQMNGKSDSK